jgi:hypothetical protein
VTNHAERLRKLCDAGAKATPRRMDTLPDTGAGQVWVRALGEPLLEPTHFWGTLAKLFRVRSDAYPRVERQWVSDGSNPETHPHWVQKQADAEFFAAAANARATLALAARIVEATQTYRDAIEQDDGSVSQNKKRWAACRALDALLRQWASDTGTGESQNE